nr:hypothetical protein OG781_42375 [Streptomyces sp. NBC_00830]
MSRQAQALYVQPNGHTEPFYLDDDPKRQQADIAVELDGPVTAWQLGRHMTVHTGAPAYERTRNEPVRCAWRDLAGAEAPDLRGPVIVTGPECRDGLLQPLPPQAAERVDRWARLLREATIRRRPQMSAVQAVGTRDLQCDTHAVHHDRDSGRWAFVVLDGIGDEEDIQEHVRTWAPELARAAARSGDPVSAIAHIRAQIPTRLGRRWGHMDPAAAAVVAVGHPTNPLLRLAWSGGRRRRRRRRLINSASPPRTPRGELAGLGAASSTGSQRWRSPGCSPGRSPAPTERSNGTSSRTHNWNCAGSRPSHRSIRCGSRSGSRPGKDR